MASYAHVALPLPLRRTFEYRLPDALRDRVRLGSQVQVPFRGRPRRGIVVELSETNGRLDAHDIAAVVGEPLFDEHLLAFTRWMADYYLAPWGEVLAGALPGGGEGLAKSRARRAAVEDTVLTAALPDRFSLSREQRAAAEALERAIGAGRFAPMLLQEKPRIVLIRFQGEGQMEELIKPMKEAVRWIGENRTKPNLVK